MSNFIYPKAKEAMLSGLNVTTSAVHIVLSNDATAGVSTDDMLSDIAGGDIIASSAALASKTILNGVFDAADVTFTSLAAGPAVRGYWVVRTSDGLLISWTDTNQNTTPINVTPDGTNFTLRFSSSGIFQL